MRIFIALLFVVGCKASAQALPDDPLGPVRCFEILDAAEVASDTAYQMCSGARSDAPGRCYAEGIDHLKTFSQQQILQLCANATDLQPIACAEHLDALGTVTEQQAIDFCGTHCPIGPPPPQVSNAACLSIATDQAGLALKTAGELCLGSRSAGPAECFLAGSKINHLASSKLVIMCADSPSCQYVSSSGAAGGYGPGYGAAAGAY